MKFAIILSDPEDSERSQKFFQEKIMASRRISPETEICIFFGIEGLQQSILDLNQLAGIAIDRKVLPTVPSETAQLALKVFELIQLPILNFSTSHLSGGAMERKILDGQWNHFDMNLGKYSPRGLRSHDRQVVHLRVLVKAKETQQNIEFKSVTSDLSHGGCFVVLFDDPDFTDDLYVTLDESQGIIKCRLAWKLSWGDSKYHMPGAGLQFVDVPSSARKILHKYLDPEDGG